MNQSKFKPITAITAITAIFALTICLIGCGVGSDDDKDAGANTDSNTDAKSESDLEPVKLRISKETTFFEGPLRSDGTVDYTAAYNAYVSKGATPQNNAFSLILQASGPGVLQAEKRDALQRKVGMQPLPLEGDYYTSLIAFIELTVSPEKLKVQYHEIEVEGRDEPFRIPYQEGIGDAYEHFGNAQERPWRVEDYPQIAIWLRKNEKPLDMLEQASRRSRLYVPTIALPGESDFNVAVASFEITDACHLREMAQALIARAMSRLHYGHRDQAWDDIMAVHRLGELGAQSPHVIALLVGVSFRLAASEATVEFITTKGVTAEQLARCAAEYKALGPMPTLYETINVSERTNGLTAVMFLWEKMKGNPELGPNRDMFRKLVDINAVLEQVNGAYDQIAAYLEEPGHPVRLRPDFDYWDDWDERRDASKYSMDDPRAWFEFPEGATPKDMRDHLTMTMAESIEFAMAPLLGGASYNLRHAETKRDLANVAIGLERYRLIHGQYPDQLTKLIPSHVKFLPVDRYAKNDQVIRYRKTSDGYRLYAVGRNRKDEDGRYNPRNGEDIDDDVAIIVPIPAED